MDIRTTNCEATEKHGAVQREKDAALAERLESFDDAQGNLIYENAEDEPALHARTYVALAAMFMLNFVQIIALQSPPAVLAYIGRDLNASETQTWIPNSLSLVQAVLSPIVSSASDTFQARKMILVGSTVVSFIGAAIAPGAKNIYQVIGAQVMIGFGFAAVPLAYVVPSEILPRKWRPAAQGALNVAASCAAVTGPMSIGALTKSSPENGWRNFYWVQMALWGVTALGIFVGYRPPKRHTRYDHLSLWQKVAKLDLVGFFLLTAGLTLFLTGMNLGGGLYKWDSSQVLGTLIPGIIVLISFGGYEWKGTKTGILHCEMFKGGKEKGRTFVLCVALIFIEGIMLFAFVIFYPELSGDLFTTDPVLLVARSQPFWVACAIGTAIYGYVSSKLRSIRSPLFIGFLLFTAGIIGLATIEPGQSTNALVFVGLAGLGFGAPLVLVVAGVQLAVPHHLIATASAVTTSARAIAATVFTTGYAAAVQSRMERYVPQYVSAAAVGAGLPRASVPAFITALSAHNQTELSGVAGATSTVVTSGMMALKHAQADSIRVVFIIAAPFGALACITCFFLGDLSKTMNYRVDAPVEGLRAKGSQ